MKIVKIAIVWILVISAYYSGKSQNCDMTEAQAVNAEKIADRLNVAADQIRKTGKASVELFGIVVELEEV
jgi:hypothetical protein